MTGAYVAKPAITILPNYPADWNANWDYPGPPYSPGYTPDYSYIFTADATIIPGNATTTLGTTIVDGGYATSAPTGSATLKAVWKDSETTVRMRKVSGGDFSDSVDLVYGYVGGFYCSSEQVYFDIDKQDIGKTLTVSVSGTPFTGSDLSGSSDISVIGSKTLVVLATGSTSIPQPPPNPSVSASIIFGPSIDNWSDEGCPYVAEDVSGKNTGNIGVDCTFTMNKFISGVNYFWLTIGGDFGGTASMSGTIKMYENGGTEPSHTFSFSKSNLTEGEFKLIGFSTENDYYEEFNE